MFAKAYIPALIQKTTLGNEWPSITKSVVYLYYSKHS